MFTQRRSGSSNARLLPVFLKSARRILHATHLAGPVALFDREEWTAVWTQLAAGAVSRCMWLLILGAKKPYQVAAYRLTTVANCWPNTWLTDQAFDHAFFIDVSELLLCCFPLSINYIIVLATQVGYSTVSHFFSCLQNTQLPVGTAWVLMLLVLLRPCDSLAF